MSKQCAGKIVSGPRKGKRCRNRVSGRAKRCAFHSGKKKTSICWPGYERVPGTKAYSKGSCRKVGSKRRRKKMRRRNPSSCKRKTTMRRRKKRYRRNPSCKYTHVKFKKSSNPKKKLMAIFSNRDGGRSKTVHFGAANHNDYTIHGDTKKRANYHKSHRKRENWNKCDTAGALSRWILWGNSKSRTSNQAAFRRKFGLKAG